MYYTIPDFQAFEEYDMEIQIVLRIDTKTTLIPSGHIALFIVHVIWMPHSNWSGLELRLYITE